MARITKARTKTGDSGFSNLISGLKMKKSSDICCLQNTIQLFANELKTFVFYSTASDKLLPVHVEFLKYLYESFSNSFSAAVYFNFGNIDYSVSEERLTQLEDLIETLDVPATEEFMIIDKVLLQLEKVMIYVRQIEHLFWKALEENNYYFIGDTSRITIIQNFAKFLNALSDYFFLMIRDLSEDILYWNKEI